MIATDQHQAIYRRWRAQTFGQVIGQEAVVTALRNAIRDGRLAHGLLFAGPRGTGKTSVARIVAKALNCPNVRDGEPCDTCPACVAIREGRALDVVELDAASNRGIDEVRSLRERLAYAPSDLRRKVYILDEAHQITRDAWNALLKSIEEPPDFVTFIFASTHPQGFPPAILSRLQRYDFRRLSVAEIAGKLERILVAEGRTASPDAVHLIAELAAGGMRDAETILDQLLASGLDAIEVDDVRALLGLADPETVEALVRALVAGDALAGLTLLDDLEERGRDLRTVLDQTVDRVRHAIVAELAQGANPGRLVDVARRLAAIDPTATTPGGLRLQIELCFLGARDGADRSPAMASSAAPIGAAPPPPGREAEVPVPPRPPASPVTPNARPRGRTASTAAAPGPSPSVAAPSSEALERRPRAPGSASPPASPPEAAAAPEPPSGNGPASRTAGAAVEDVLRRWPEIVARLSRRPPLRPLIVECRPIQVDGATIVLGFPEEKAFLRDVAERRRVEIEDGMAAVLERPVSVRCVATNLDGYPPLALDPEGARLLAEAKRIFGDDLVDVGEIT
ncbi:MAG TPA: DNA polymerase III subunit gamma/tau [Candidatus Binatia bacterium]|nr:DNA polymerase III subunit gamma/tau [Candidatus Binatia bacterium]